MFYGFLLPTKKRSHPIGRRKPQNFPLEGQILRGRNFRLALTGISSRARPLAHTCGVRPAVYLLCACCLREMASLVLRVDVRVYTCSKTRNGCWPWPEGVTLAPPKSTWEQPHPGRSRDLKTWVLEMTPGNCTKPGFSTRFSMLRMDPRSPDSGRA